MKAVVLVFLVFCLAAASFGAPNLVYWVSRHSAVVDSFPVDGNVNQQTNFITSFGNSLDFRKEYLKTTRAGAAVHIAPGRVIYVFGRQGNSTTLPAPIVGIADPFSNSAHEFRLSAEPGEIVYNVLEFDSTAIVITSKVSFDSPVDSLGLHEISFASNGSISLYRRLKVTLPVGANITLLQPSPCAADSSFVYIRVGSGGIDAFDLLALVISRTDGSVTKVPLPSVLNGFSPVEEWYPGAAKGSLFVFLSSMSIVDDEIVANVTLWAWNLGSSLSPVALLQCPTKNTATSFFVAPTQGTIDKTSQPWVYHRVVTCTLSDPPTASAFLFSIPLTAVSDPIPAVAGRQVPNDLSTSWGLTLAY